MSLTIIIVNWNGGELLLRCLRSIRASRQSFPVKVIVVDNDSQDGSREQAQHEFPEFHIFNSGSNLGFGRANNLARSRVDTGLVLFLNPDTELMPDTLERAVQCQKAHPEVGMFGCKMLYPDGTLQKQGLQWFPSPWTVLAEMLLPPRVRWGVLRRWLPLFDPDRNTYARKLYGGFLLAPKSVLDSAGWFDDRYFMYAEDVDLSRTITDLGWKLYYCADAEIIHASGGTSRKAPSGFSLLAKNESVNQLIRKYQGPWAARAHRLVVLVGVLPRLGVALAGWVGSRLVPGGESQLWKARLAGQKLLLLWALGHRKAIPTSAPAVPQFQAPASAS